MPYTGVKGEFEVVGFTTLTYVLVLVGTYGASCPFRFQLDQDLLQKWCTHRLAAQPPNHPGMTDLLYTCHAGYAFYIQVPLYSCGALRNTHVLVSRRGSTSRQWQQLHVFINSFQMSIASCSRSRWPCWRSCPLGSGLCRYCRGEQQSPYWVGGTFNILLSERSWLFEQHDCSRMRKYFEEAPCILHHRDGRIHILDCW